MTNLKFFRIEKHALKHVEYPHGNPRNLIGFDSASKYRPIGICNYFDNGPDFRERWVGVEDAVRDEAEEYGMTTYASFMRKEKEMEDREALKKLLSVVRERAGLGCLEEAVFDDKGRRWV
jgi:hypothetical protein